MVSDCLDDMPLLRNRDCSDAGNARSLTIVLAGGGTAGHVNPLLAVASALQRLHDEQQDRRRGIQQSNQGVREASDEHVGVHSGEHVGVHCDEHVGVHSGEHVPALLSLNITVIGTQEGLESTLVPAAGLHLRCIDKLPFPRKPNLAALKFPKRWNRVCKQARQILLDTNADVVVGFGGYAAAPVYWAAHRLGIPVIVHEQNARAGIANRLGARWAEFIGTVYDATGLKPRRDAILEQVGLPLREKIAQLCADKAVRDSDDIDAKGIVGASGVASASAVCGSSVDASATSNNASGQVISNRSDSDTDSHFSGSISRDPSVRSTANGSDTVRVSDHASSTMRSHAAQLFGFDPHRPILLVTGGSLGAVHLNESIAQSAADLVKCCQVIHLTGNGKDEQVMGMLRSELPNDQYAHCRQLRDGTIVRVDCDDPLLIEDTTSSASHDSSMAFDHAAHSSDCTVSSASCGFSPSSISTDSHNHSDASNSSLLSNTSTSANSSSTASTSSSPSTSISHSSISSDACACSIPSSTTSAASYIVMPYMTHMEQAFACADLVLCRSGAGTVAELSALGLPAIYVPLPIGNGEQRLNALPVVKQGGAILINDAQCDARWVATAIPTLLQDTARLRQMARKSYDYGIRDAALRMATVILELAASHARNKGE